MFCPICPQFPFPERPGTKNINLANNKMVPFLRKEQLFDRVFLQNSEGKGAFFYFAFEVGSL